MDDTDDTGNTDGPPRTADAGGADPAAPSGRARTRSGRLARQAARRHRRERIAGVLIALLGVAVLVVAFLALRNPKPHASAAGTDTHQQTPPASSTSSKPVPSPSHPLTVSRSARPSSDTSSATGASQPLIVLNQTTTPDLAQQAAQRFRSGGWQVSGVQEGYQNDVITTTAYYDPAVPGAQKAAQALARQYPTIHRVAEKFPELPAGPVVVVLTTDYSST